MDKNEFFEEILDRIHFPQKNIVPLESSGNAYRPIIFHTSGRTFYAEFESLRHQSDVDDIVAYLDDVWTNQSLCKNRASYLTMQSNYNTNLALMNKDVTNFITSLNKSLGTNACAVNIEQTTTFNLKVTLLSNNTICNLPSHFDNTELHNTLMCVLDMINANGQPLDYYIKAVIRAYQIVEIDW